MKQMLLLFLFLGGTLIFVLIAGAVLTFQQVQNVNVNNQTAKTVTEQSQGIGDQSQPTRNGIALDPSPTWMDVTWPAVESEDNVWTFDVSDTTLQAARGEVIARVFYDQKSSGVAPWIEGSAGSDLTPEAKDYLATVIDRYGDRVRFWQLGNAMDMWVSEGVEGQQESDEFRLEQQRAFLQNAARFIRERDQDAVIVLPAMSELNMYSIDKWLTQMLSEGTDWFDIVAYEYGDDWKQFGGQHDVLRAALAVNNADHLATWLTQIEGADVFKNIVQAYGYGDDYVRITTEVPGKLDKITSVTMIEHSLSERNIFEVRTSEEHLIITWGSGSFETPDDGLERLSNEPLILPIP